jgi:esterase/lipase
MKTYPIRTRFAKEIVAEVMIPEKQTGKVLIILGGMPSIPSKPETLEYFCKKGFLSIMPRYRGTWESEGVFLKNDPVQDIFDIVDEISSTSFSGVYNSFTNTINKVRINKIYVLGGSFGGTGALLASRHTKVRKVVALAPVIDWTYDSSAEPFSFFERFVPYAFGDAYRYKKDALKKLYANKIYSPLKDTSLCVGKKILIIHSKSDHVVAIDPVYSFIRDTEAELFEVRGDEHFGPSDATRVKFAKRVLAFLN